MSFEKVVRQMNRMKTWTLSATSTAMVGRGGYQSQKLRVLSDNSEAGVNCVKIVERFETLHQMIKYYL